MFYVIWQNASNTRGGATYLCDVGQIELLLEDLAYDDSDFTITIKKVYKK